MIDQYFQERELTIPPVSFRVFGIGEKTLSILNEIDSWGYQGVKTIIFGKEEISPSEEDEMVIFINPDNYDISLLTQLFFQADILILVIASAGFNEITSSYDAVCLTEQTFIKNTVLGILYPLFHHGYIEFDFDDMLRLMKGQGKFKIYTDVSEKSDKKLDSLMLHFKEVIKQSGTIDNVAIILSFNYKTYQSTTTNDLRIVQETTRTLPETTYVRWQIVIDEKFKDNQIKMITFFSGQNLNF
ncbi:MAG: hypothetical protein J1E16_02345 [Muribaculaceae bacterium]|nr:hypothetical protein [Muribaculaceae bacterium]